MFLPLLFNKLIIAAWLKLKRQLKLVISFIHKTKVMNKEKATWISRVKNCEKISKKESGLIIISVLSVSEKKTSWVIY